MGTLVPTRGYYGFSPTAAADAAVIAENEIILNGTRFRTKGPVQSALSSIYPQKTVTGDYTRDSQQRASVFAMSDWRRGIGLNIQRGDASPVSRAWWSTCQLRYHEHLVLPALATVTAASGVAGSFTIGAIGELGGEIYAAFGTDVRKYSNAGDSWGSSLHTLPAAATSAITFRMGGVVYLAFATTGTPGGYSYTSDGATWVNDTKDTQFLAYWDDRLWGIDSTGQLWFSSAIGVETNDAQLPLEDNSVTSLFVGPLADGELVLHAGTTYGPYSHDVENSKFVPVDIGLAQHPDNCKGSVHWRESMFFSAGNGIHRYNIGEGRPGISVMGPDRDDGLPSDKRGTIVQLLKTTNELVAVLDATTAPGSLSTYSAETALNAADVIGEDVGFSLILGWDGEGWETKWISGSSAQAISYAYVSNAYSTYRLWWGHNQRVNYMALPRDIVNPNEITTFEYAASAEHETPWFNADQTEVDKLITELRVEAHELSSTETITVSYGLNYGAGYTSLGTITADGITSYKFPNSTTPTGTTFRAIRFKVSLARGSTTTVTPHAHSLTITFRKKLPAKYGHTVEVDLNNEYGGKSPKQLRAALKAILEVNTLVVFTFRADTGTPRTHYVDVVQATGLEHTGLDERGSSSIICLEL